MVSIASLYGLRHYSFRDNGVIVVEPNSFHGEILPGFCKYLTDSGFSLTLLVRYENFNGKIFSMVPPNEQPRIVCMAPWAMKRFLRRQDSNTCALVFVTSSFLSDKFGYFGLFFEYLRFTPQARLGYLLVEHHFPALIPHLTNGDVELKRVFQLSPHEYNGHIVPMLNPHYFGSVVHRSKSPKTIFVTVGSLSSRNRSPDQLLDAVANLTNRGITNFEVVVIGRDISALKHKNISSVFRVLGALDFESLFYEIGKSDFILPLLDPGNDGHRRYLTGETTGSRQLILGFRKPPIIHEEFGTHYGFTDEMAVLYSSDQLAEAMGRAIAMTSEEYDAQVENLARLASQIYQISIRNLQTVLAGLLGRG